MLLTHGARSVVWHAKAAPRPTSLQQWAMQTEQRRGRNVAAVAVANRLARIVWAVWGDPDKNESGQNRYEFASVRPLCGQCETQHREGSGSHKYETGATRAPTVQASLVVSGRVNLCVVIETELTALGRGEERPGPIFVDVRHYYLDRPQSIERQPVSVSQRLTPQLAGNPRRFQEGPDLLRLNLTICGEYRSSMIHAPLLIGQNMRRSVARAICRMPPANDRPDASHDGLPLLFFASAAGPPAVIVYVSNVRSDA
jgi:hypothetical protein